MNRSLGPTREERVVESMRKAFAALKDSRDELDTLLEMPRLNIPSDVRSDITNCSHGVRRAMEFLTTERILDWYETILPKAPQENPARQALTRSVNAAIERGEPVVVNIPSEDPEPSRYIVFEECPFDGELHKPSECPIFKARMAD